MSDRYISIDSPNELKKYGIIWLTGEADPYALRVLCDLTDAGQNLIKEFLGLSDISTFKNWNSSEGATGSFLLPRCMYMDLVKFIMFHVEGMDCVSECYNGYHGYKSETVETAHESFKEKLIWNYNKTRSNRNVHAMSGRVE